MENLILRLGRPRRIRRPAKHALARPRTWCGPGQAPASAQRLTRGSRTTERQTGEEERTAAWLVVGDSSGEAIGANVFTSPMHT